MSKTLNKVPVVLLVDDDPGDRELTRRALLHHGEDIDLRTASDGEEAMQYLCRQEAFADPASAPRPDLILLDLNMPRVDGRQVLERLRADPDLRRIPVVVLTTSGQEEDILRSYDLGCNSFVTKPVQMEAFIEALRTLGVYWFDVTALPSR